MVEEDYSDFVEKVIKAYSKMLLRRMRQIWSSGICPWQPFENSLLDGWDKPIPKGNQRHENPEWAKHVQSQVFPNHSDVDWWEYVLWVEEGAGDEWFQIIEPEQDEPL